METQEDGTRQIRIRPFAHEPSQRLKVHRADPQPPDVRVRQGSVEIERITG
jgi:hypothetical protein